MNTEIDRLAQTVYTWVTHWSRPEIGHTDFIPPMVPLTPELSAMLDKVAAAEDAYHAAQEAPEEILADARSADAAYLATVRDLGIAAADGKAAPKTLPKPVNIAEVETRVRIAMTAADAAGGRLRKAQSDVNAAILADRPRWPEHILAWLAETDEERAEARRRAQTLDEMEALANEGLRLAHYERPGPKRNTFVRGASYPVGLV